MSFDDSNKLNIKVMNIHRSTYQIIFGRQADGIFDILLFGQWGVISEKDKTMAGAIGDSEQYASEVEDMCTEFGG